MSDKLPEPQNGQQGPNAQDPSRRRLLRAAASAAPLIATLPSGVALAASAAPCVVQNRDLTNPPGDTGGPTQGLDYTVGPSTDGWLRYGPVSRAKWTRTIGTTTEEAFAYEFPMSGGGKKWYLETTGAEFIPTPPAPEVPWIEDTSSRRDDIYVLRLYAPKDDPASPTYVTRPVPCLVPLIDDATLPYGGSCVFPFRRRGGAENLLGMNASCMTSVLP
jgi:hypothetical protein